jgi:histidine phosphotransferase ChpT
MARGFLDDKIKLTWNMQRVLLPKNRVKLLLNMLVLAVGTIPRGGTLMVNAIGERRPPGSFSQRLHHS